MVRRRLGGWQASTSLRMLRDKRIRLQHRMVGNGGYWWIGRKLDEEDLPPPCSSRTRVF
jgi:hypothetical protein